MTPFVLLLLPALAVTLAGLAVLAGGMRRLRRRRALAGLTGVLAGLALFAAGLLGNGLAAALFHYQRLNSEEPVAWLGMRQLGPQQFAVRLTDASGRHRSFELHGDQWQLDARVLRWRLPALLAGAPNLYRLERLSGRYDDIEQEREAVRSVHALDRDAFPDLWQLRRQFPEWLGFVDAEFGSGSYLPMLDGAQYTVSLGPRGGLVARPADDATAAALRASGW